MAKKRTSSKALPLLLVAPVAVVALGLAASGGLLGSFGLGLVNRWRAWRKSMGFGGSSSPRPTSDGMTRPTAPTQEGGSPFAWVRDQADTALDWLEEQAGDAVTWVR